MQATVRDAMTTDVVSVPRHTSIADAEQLLLEHGAEELFILDPGGVLCGVVPDYELLKWRLSPCSVRQTVESLMSRRFLVIGADSSLRVAARYLREHIHRRLAVVEGRNLIGQITRQRVLNWLSSLSDAARSDISESESLGDDSQRVDAVAAPSAHHARIGRARTSILSTASVSRTAR